MVASDAEPWRRIWRASQQWLGALAAICVILAGLQAAAHKMLDPALFPLRHVRLMGEFRNPSEADLQQRVKKYLGRNFFTLDVEGLRKAVADEPWIEKVSVRRQWPDTVEIRFRERVAFGRWGDNEMVDVNGMRFRPTVVREAGPWPQLMGPDGHEKTLIRAYLEGNAMLAAVDLKIKRLVLDERRAWSMWFTNGVKVKLGREQFAERLQRFVDIYPETLARRIGQVAAIDLRYINGFAVRWNQQR